MGCRLAFNAPTYLRWVLNSHLPGSTLSARITGVCHHTWYLSKFNKNQTPTYARSGRLAYNLRTWEAEAREPPQVQG